MPPFGCYLHAKLCATAHVDLISNLLLYNPPISHLMRCITQPVNLVALCLKFLKVLPWGCHYGAFGFTNENKYNTDWPCHKGTVWSLKDV